MHIDEIKDDPEFAVMTPYGRLYLRPEDVPIKNELTKNVRQSILDGKLLPSVTNVLGVRDKPFLVPWAAKIVATKAVELANAYPERMKQAPEKAIQYLKGLANADRDAAATQGSKVHRAAETLALGREMPTGLSPAEMFYVDKWKKWRNDWQVEFLEVEATFIGDGYAGTADFVARIMDRIVIGDLKTTRSGLHIDLSLQLSALANASHMISNGKTIENPYKFAAGIGVHLSTQDYHVKQASIDGQTWEVFKSLRDVWNFHVFEGHLDNNQYALGQIISDPKQIIFS